MATPLNNNPGPPFNVPQSYLQAFRPTSMSSSNRFDEGYSEETRSQTGSDLVIRPDSSLEDTVVMDQDPQHSLPDWVLNMSESERSGMKYYLIQKLGDTIQLTYHRICIRTSTVAPDILNRKYSGKAQSSVTSGSCHDPASRSYLPNILLPQPRNTVARLYLVPCMAHASLGQPVVEIVVPAGGMEC